jgi:hypothetical protein
MCCSDNVRRVAAAKSRSLVGHNACNALASGIAWNGKWTFPIHVAPVRNEHCTATWNYVLSAGHEMIVGGIKCATLGEEKGKFLAAFCLLSPNFKATESSTSRETFARRPIGDETSSKTWRKCQGSRWEWWSFTSRKL